MTIKAKWAATNSLGETTYYYAEFAARCHAMLWSGRYWKVKPRKITPIKKVKTLKRSRGSAKSALEAFDKSMGS